MKSLPKYHSDIICNVAASLGDIFKRLHVHILLAINISYTYAQIQYPDQTKKFQLVYLAFKNERRSSPARLYQFFERLLIPSICGICMSLQLSFAVARRNHKTNHPCVPCMHHASYARFSVVQDIERRKKNLPDPDFYSPRNVFCLENLSARNSTHKCTSFFANCNIRMRIEITGSVRQ